MLGTKGTCQLLTPCKRKIFICIIYFFHIVEVKYGFWRVQTKKQHSLSNSSYMTPPWSLIQSKWTFSNENECWPDNIVAMHPMSAGLQNVIVDFKVSNKWILHVHVHKIVRLSWYVVYKLRTHPINEGFKKVALTHIGLYIVECKTTLTSTSALLSMAITFWLSGWPWNISWRVKFFPTMKNKHVLSFSEN